MKKYVMSWHLNYKSGAPTSIGGASLHDSQEDARRAICELIDEDIERYRARMLELGVAITQEDFFHSYDGSDPALTFDCDGYSDIDNEECFYYITETEIKGGCNGKVE